MTDLIDGQQEELSSWLVRLFGDRSRRGGASRNEDAVAIALQNDQALLHFCKSHGFDPSSSVAFKSEHLLAFALTVADEKGSDDYPLRQAIRGFLYLDVDAWWMPRYPDDKRDGGPTEQQLVSIYEKVPSGGSRIPSKEAAKSRLRHVSSRKRWALALYKLAMSGGVASVPSSVAPFKNIASECARVLLESIGLMVTNPSARATFLDHYGGSVLSDPAELGSRPPTSIQLDTHDGAIHDLMLILALDLEKPPPHYPSERFSTINLATRLSLADLAQYKYSADTVMGRYDPAYARESVLNKISKSRRVIILGDPGAGKSTVLAAYLATHLRKKRNAVGVFVSLANLASKARLRAPKTEGEAISILVETFRESFPHMVSDTEILVLEEKLKSGLSVICLDALDEVDDPDSFQAVLNTLRLLNDGASQIVLSSRTTGYSSPIPDLKELAVEELSDAQVRKFLKRWFSPSHLTDNLTRLKNLQRQFPQVQRLARNPMMAGMIAYVAEDSDLPTEIGALYDRYVANYLRRIWKPWAQSRGDDFQIDVLVTTATEIAWSMATRSSRPGSQIDTWETTTTIGQVRRSVGDMAAAHALFRTDGLLVLRGLSNPRESEHERRFGWLHKSIHEHLVGRHLAEWYSRDPRTALEYIADAASRPRTWKEPLAHMTSLLSATDRDLVVGHLLESTTTYFFERVRQTILELTPQLSAGSKVRAAAYDESAKGGYWRRILLADPGRAIGEAVALWTRKSYTFEGAPWAEVKAIPRKLLPSEGVLTAVGRDPEYDGSLAIQFLARLNPDKTIELLTERVLAGRDPGLSWFGKLKVTAQTRERLLQLMRSEPIPIKWGVDALLQHVKGGYDLHRDVSEREPTLRLELEAKYIHQAREQDLQLDEEVLSAAIAGIHGPWAAAVIGAATPRLAFSGRQLSAWTEVFSYYSALRNMSLDDLAALLTSDADQTISPHIDMPDDSAGNSSDPAILLKTLRQLHRAATYREAGIAALGDFLGKRRYEANETGLPSLTNHELGNLAKDLIGRLVSKVGWDLSWPILKKSIRNRRALAHNETFVRTSLEAMIAVSSIDPKTHERITEITHSDRFLAVIGWGIRKRIPVLHVLPVPSRNPDLLGEVFTLATNRWLSRGEHDSALINWLTDSGSLPLWKTRVAHIDRWRKWRALW